MSRVSLFINGKIYENWISVSISIPLNGLSGQFSLETFIDSSLSYKNLFGVSPFDECSLSIEGEPVITGYVDSVSIRKKDNGTQIVFSGRHKTADLVDCSLKLKNYSWENINPVQLIKSFCKPFGVGVVPKIALSTLKKFTVSPGETVLEVITRLVINEGFAIYSNGLGQLVIDNVGSILSVDSLEEGKNILEYSLEFDGANRFSDYYIVGQGTTSDEYFGEKSNQVLATSKDSYIKRFRPLIIESESETTSTKALKRAQFEAARKAAESSSATVKVPLWTNSKGELWKINEIIKLKIGSLSYLGNALISSVSFNKNGEDESTLLNLENKNAYTKSGLISKDDLWEIVL